MESVIPLHSDDNSESDLDWDVDSEHCSESILATTPSEKFWSRKVSSCLWIRMINTVYTGPYGRCLIDNTVQDVASSYVYCLSRRLEPQRVNALEFAWGMQRGTLNLNTRLNVLCLSPKFKDLWQILKWFLLPEECIIRRFHKAAMDDQDLPDIGEGPYNYYFVPHPDLKTVGIHRQINQETTSLKLEDFMFCSYPFENIGTLTCHLHPKFVIFHIGWIVARADKTFLSKYVDAHPDLLESIIMCLQICNKWSRLLDKTNPKHLSFLKNKINPDDVINEKYSSTGNGRIKPYKNQKRLREARTGVKRKRKGSPPHFVPTRKLQMLEEKISPEHAAQRKLGDILSSRFTAADADDTHEVPTRQLAENNDDQTIDTKAGVDVEMS